MTEPAGRRGRPRDRLPAPTSTLPARGSWSRRPRPGGRCTTGPAGCSSVRPLRPRGARPAGVTVFDAASWNGIAIDSTCGGHGTCKKCKDACVAGSVAASRLDIRSFSPEQLRAGWRLACLAQAEQDLRVEVPPLTTRPKAATVGVGRQVILRPAVQKRYVELAEPTLADQRPDLTHPAARRDRRPRPAAGPARPPPAAEGPAAGDYRVTAVIVDEALVDVEPGDTTDRRFGDRLRPRHHDRGGHPPRPRHRHPAGRALDAQQAAALRRRRDHADQRHDARPRRPRPAHARRARDPGRAHRAGSARRRRSTGARCTRSRWPATRR